VGHVTAWVEWDTTETVVDL